MVKRGGFRVRLTVKSARSLKVPARPGIPTAEEEDLKSLQCGFKSHSGHMTRNNHLGLEVMDMGFPAHLTIHYLGTTDRRQQLEIQDWIHEQQLKFQTFYATRKSIDLFGPRNNLPVVRVTLTDEVIALHEEAKRRWPGPGNYPWTPHITIKLEEAPTVHIPTVFKLINFNLY